MIGNRKTILNVLFRIPGFTGTPPWTVPSPAEKGGGLCMGPATPSRKKTQRLQKLKQQILTLMVYGNDPRENA